MKPEKDNDNLAVPNTEISTNADEADISTDQTAEKIVTDRRTANKMILGGLIGLSLFGLPDRAKADEDPHYDRLKAGGFFDRFKGKTRLPDKLTEAEKPILNESMKIIFEHYVYRSFRRALARQNKEKECIKVLETAITNREDLHYSKDTNGHITITKRTPNGPNVNIKIQSGLITEINGVKIIYSDAQRGQYVLSHADEKKQLDEKIERIWPKVITMLMSASGMKMTGPNQTPPRFSKEELAWFELFTMQFPQQIHRLLELKGKDLTREEKKEKRTLQRLLRNHPTNFAESGSGPGKKRLQFFAIKRNNTPNGVVELITSNTGPRPSWFRPIMYISLDGYLVDKDGNKLDKRKMPFVR